jgi:hypothetical protein
MRDFLRRFTFMARELTTGSALDRLDAVAGDNCQATHRQYGRRSLRADAGSSPVWPPLPGEGTRTVARDAP